jgi:hypothetical protein
MDTPKSMQDAASYVPPVLFLCSISLAVAAVFSPWFRWSEHTWLTAGGRWLNTTNLNHLLPSIAVGTREAVGAQINDGNRVLWIGHVARLIVLGISLSSLWLLVRNKPLRNQILISILVLPLLLVPLAYVVLTNWMIDLGVLADDTALPYVTGLDWRGPTFLVGAILLYTLALLAHIKPRSRPMHA